MSVKRAIIGVGLGLLLLSIPLLLLVNFHLASSRTETAHSFSVYRARPDGAAPAAVASLAYGVNGDEAETLAAALSTALSEELSVGQTAARPAEPGHPYLLVEIEQADVRWTPVWAAAEVVARVSYASTGDMVWRHQETVIMSRQEGDPVDAVVKARGDFEVDDESWGLLSRPAYYDRLADALAAEIEKALQTQVLQASS
ncbi:MAG: hypothetical protein R3300_01220 [Candidatus Promineifilaceae bacterium]|nr:hypothetical protein [Candidatus Promineifilaceae bacterium]